MAYNRQKASGVSLSVRTTGNCFEFAIGTAGKGARPSGIATPYDSDKLTEAIVSAGGKAVTTPNLFMEYRDSGDQYFLVAAMLKGSQEFHFVRMGLLDSNRPGWIGKWSKVGTTYSLDYNGPQENSEFSTVNAILLKQQNGNSKYSPVGYFAFAVPP